MAYINFVGIRNVTVDYTRLMFLIYYGGLRN